MPGVAVGGRCWCIQGGVELPSFLVEQVQERDYLVLAIFLAVLSGSVEAPHGVDLDEGNREPHRLARSS